MPPGPVGFYPSAAAGEPGDCKGKTHSVCFISEHCPGAIIFQCCQQKKRQPSGSARNTPLFPCSRHNWHGMCPFKQIMASRRQDTDVIGLIARWAGFVLLICLFSSAVRRSITALGFMAVGLSVLVVVSLVGFGIYRMAAWRSGTRTATENPFAPSTDDSDPTWNDDEPEATLDLLEPALRRRYPWRHGIADHL